MPRFESQINIVVPSGTAPLLVNQSTLVANLNADLLDGQHGSYFEGRDTTAIGFSGGSLTLTRTAGNLSVSLDGRYLPLTGGTLTGSLNGTTASFSGNVKGGRVTLRDDCLEQHVDDSDSVGIFVNYFGYASGTTRFRNFGVFNGKNQQLFYITGSTGATAITGTLSVTGAITQGGNQVLHAGNYTNYAIRSQGGLSVDISNTSLDTATTTGFFRGNAMTGAPDAGWWYVIVESHDLLGTSGWVKQTVTAYGAGNSYTAGTTFIRVRQGGSSWNGWIRELDSVNFNSFALPLTGGVLTGALTGTTATFSGNVALNARVSFGNRQPVYSLFHGGNQDLAWKKIADITFGTALYSAATFKVDVIDANTNFGSMADCKPMTFFVSCRRSGGVLNDADNALVFGPVADYVRAVKTATGVYELQIRQIADWLNHIFIVEIISQGAGTVTYVTGTPANGSTTGTIYLPTTGGYTQRFTNLAVTGATTFGGVAAFSAASGTYINTGGGNDAFGYNATAGLGHYIKGTGNTYIYGGGAFFDGSTTRTLLHAGNYNSYALPLTGGTITGQLSVNGSTASDILRLYTTGSTIWKLGVTDASGSFFNITADFGNFTINKLNGNITTPGAFVSTVATGTAPLSVTSTTLVGNLNSDLLDGQHGSYFENRDTTAIGFSGGTLTLTRAAGNLTANLDGRYLPLSGGTVTGNLYLNSTLQAGYSRLKVFDYNLNNTPTNGIRIATTIPQTSGVGMYTLIFEGYRYGDSAPEMWAISFYPYNTGSGVVFINYGGSCHGGKFPSLVQLGWVGGFANIFILTDLVYYRRFAIRAVSGGQGEPNSHFEGWVVSDSNPTLAGATGVVSVPFTNEFGSAVVKGTLSVTGAATLSSTLAVTGAITQNGNQVLHAGNYSTYALPLTGGTLTGNLTLSGSSQLFVGSHMSLQSSASIMGMIGFNRNVANGAIYNGSYGAYQLHNDTGTLNLQVYNSAGGFVGAHTFNSSGNVAFLTGTVTAGGNQVLHAGNYSSYALPLTGGTLTGALTINATGSVLGTAYNHYTYFGGTTAGSIRGSNEGYIVISSNSAGTSDKSIYLNSAASIQFDALSHYRFNKPSTAGYQTVALFGTAASGLFLTTDSPIISTGAYYNNGWIATTANGSLTNYANGAYEWSTFSGATVGSAPALVQRMTLSNAGTLNVVGAITQGGNQVLHAGNFNSYAMLTTGIPSGSDQYVNFRVIRNSAAGNTDGMYIGYGNAGSGRTRIYSEGSTTSHVYPDSSGNLFRSDGAAYLHSSNYTSYTAPNAANLPYSWSNTANVSVFSGSYGYNSGAAKYLLLWQRTSGATGTNGRFVDGMLKVWRGANHAGNGGTVGYVHASSGYSGQSSEVLNYTPFSGQGLTFSSVVYNSVEWIAVAMPVSDYFWEFRGNYGIQGDTTTVPILVQAGQAGVGAVTNLATGSPIITSSTYSLFSSFTGTVSGSNFSGPGTGLTGLAAGLSIGGNAATATRLTNLTSTTTSTAGTDNSESCISYINGISLFGQTDGALYSHVYSASWKHNIYGDYRTGQLAVRGKNNGTWQAWRVVLDASNYTGYAIARGGDTVDGVTLFRSNKGATSTVGANNTYQLQVYTSDGGAAGMSFHRGGYYAVNMGLDPDNVLRIGGWSASANRWQLDMSGNQTLAGNLTAVNGIFSGNIGAGTSSPYGRLDLGADTGRKLFIYGQGGNVGYITGLGVDLSGSSALSFFTGIGRFEWVKGTGNYPYSAYTVQMTLDASSNLNVAGAITQAGNQVLHAGNVSTYTIPYLSAVAEASLDTATGTGLRLVNKTGYSSTLLTLNVSGSTGPFQLDANYTGVLRWRNQTDSTTWTAWKTLIHDGNYTSYPPARWATGRTISLTGDVTGTSGLFDGTAALSFAATIANSSVTYAKIQNVAVSSVLGNSSASVAQAPQALSMATLAGMLSGQTMNIVGSSTSVSAAADQAIVNQHNGSGSAWYGRILSKNSTNDRSAFLGTYGSVAGVFAHNNALTAWADLYINTVDGSSGGTVRMPSSVLINGNQALHAGNYTGYFNNFVQGAGSRGRSSSPAGNSANNLTDPSGFYFGNNVTGMPTTDWWNWTQCIGNSWSSPDGYGYQLAYSFWSDDIRMRRLQSGGWQNWVSLLHSGNYTNYAVGTANNSSLNTDSRNTRGVTRLYRRDDNSDYSVQTYWTGSYWRLYGYNGDSGHADTHVGYADSAGISASCSGSAAQLNGQAASYYENRDTTSVSISAGTLTLGRGAGNLTTTIGGRVVAWCDFNGNFASSQSPNASFNVSSITKNATGDYTVNFSSSLGTANYVVAGTAQLDTPSPGASNYNVMVAVPRRSGAKAAGSCRVVCEYPAGVALYDSISVGVAFIAA